MALNMEQQLQGDDIHFRVKVFQKQRSRRNKVVTIEVHYHQWMGSDCRFRRASLPWNGSEVGAEQAEQLLNSAQVPHCIQLGSTTHNILQCVNQILMEAKMNAGSRRLPSLIVARIESDTQPIDSDSEEED